MPIIKLWFQVFDSNDNTLDVINSNLGLRGKSSVHRQNYGGSTYLDIEHSETFACKNDEDRGSKTSIGVISTHSSQHLSMGDVEAKSYQMLSSNDELDDTSVQVKHFVLPL